MAKLPNYNGSIDLISGLRAKNNGDFPLMEAHDVQVTEEKRLDEMFSAPESWLPVYNGENEGGASGGGSGGSSVGLTKHTFSTIAEIFNFISTNNIVKTELTVSGTTQGVLLGPIPNEDLTEYNFINLDFENLTDKFGENYWLFKVSSNNITMTIPQIYIDKTSGAIDAPITVDETEITDEMLSVFNFNFYTVQGGSSGSSSSGGGLTKTKVTLAELVSIAENSDNIGALTVIIPINLPTAIQQSMIYSGLGALVAPIITLGITGIISASQTAVYINNLKSTISQSFIIASQNGNIQGEYTVKLIDNSADPSTSTELARLELNDTNFYFYIYK